MLEARGGAHGLIRTRNRWITSEGAEICSDETIIRAQPTPGGRLLDYKAILSPPGDFPLTFGDTKDGTMVVRVAGWMMVNRCRQGTCMPHTSTLEAPPLALSANSPAIFAPIA